MALERTGMQTMFPVYLARQIGSGESREEYNIGVAQNENNLNQNFAILYQKVAELEEIFAVLSG